MTVVQRKHFFSVCLKIYFVAVTVLVSDASSSDDCPFPILDSYDRFAAPQNGGEAAKVYIQMEILDLDEINEGTMDFRLHCFLRAVWKDSRISEKSLTLNDDCFSKIWHPDMIFEQAKVIMDTGAHNTYFLIRDGYFYLSRRYSFKVGCNMDFHRYPFDVQHCLFSIAFMASDDSLAVLKWFNDEGSPYRYKSPPIFFTKNIEPLQFIIKTPTTHSLTKQYLLANFTYLLANVTLTRRLTGSIVNYYMPSALLVVVSWVTFWLREDATAERVTLTMTALLTMCTQGDSYKSELPPVNYISAMDIWYFVCITMLFATLLEFALSYNAFRNRRQRIAMIEKTKGKECSKINSPEVPFEEGKDAEELEPPSPNMVSKISKRLRTMRLDSACKVLFPGFFLIFNAVYWPFYYRFESPVPTRKMIRFG